jgi:Rrf2 family protein
MALISTRGRYALRIMIDLAEHREEGFITLMDLAQRQEISEKYLEGILAVLSKNGFLEALRGRGGGYQLAYSPEHYTVGNILNLTERSIASVSCLECGATPCSRAENCRTLPLWKNLNHMIDTYLQSITLADLMQQPSCILDA